MRLSLLSSLVIMVHANLMLHITDIHYDPQYTVGSPNNCVTIPGIGCCRNDSIPLDPWNPAGQYGDFNCDSPLSLLNATLYWISINIPNIDIILWTGDTVHHHSFKQSIDANFNLIKTTTLMFKQYLPNSTLIPVLGNHDTWPIDQFASGGYSKYLYELASIWNLKFSKEFMQFGLYTVNINPSLIIINLNCLLWDSNNLLFNSFDAEFQLNWLKYQLSLSRKNKQNVWIVGHVPPGRNEFIQPYNDIFTDLLFEYRNVIVSTFWGHTHKDSFLANNYTIGFIAPSFMPDQHYPIFRIYEYDVLGIISNYHQYVSPFISTYKHVYSMKEYYNINDLSNNSLYNLAINIYKNDTYFDAYYKNMYIGAKLPECNRVCKQDIRCSILYTKLNDYNICMK
jgi:hypothetical protein